VPAASSVSASLTSYTSRGKRQSEGSRPQHKAIRKRPTQRHSLATHDSLAGRLENLRRIGPVWRNLGVNTPYIDQPSASQGIDEMTESSLVQRRPQDRPSALHCVDLREVLKKIQRNWASSNSDHIIRLRHMDLDL
jgi:hypothetical protein